MTSVKKISALLLVGVVVLSAFVGCSKESYELSDQVKFLWQQHPAPWSPATAQKAADDAKGLLGKRSKDMQLHMYYQDRMQAADHEALEKEYTELLAANPDDPRMIVLESRVVGGRAERAEKIKKALELAPDDIYIMEAAAKAFMMTRPPEIEKAAELSAKLLEVVPEFAGTYITNALLALNQGDAEKVVEYATKAREMNPYEFDAVYFLYNAYQMKQDGDAALASLEAFSEEQPLNPDALYFLEREYRQRGTLDSIADRKRLAAEANPSEGWGYYDLASFYSELEWADSVVVALNKAVENGFYDYNLVVTGLKQTDFGKKFSKSSDYKSIIKAMEAKQAETADERREEILADRLDVEAPEMVAKTLRGKEVKLSDLRGKVVVLDFWATWCGPCKMTMPLLSKFHKAGVDAKLISVNVWERMTPEERPAKVREFAKSEGLNWTVWLGENESAQAFEVTGIPTFLVIGPDGKIRYRLVGYEAFLDEKLEWMVEAIKADA